MSGFALKFEIKGLDKLKKQLRAMGDEAFAKKALRRGMTAAIRPMTKAGRELCPVSSGDLKASIDSKIAVKKRGGFAIVGSNTDFVAGRNQKKYIQAQREHNAKFNMERSARHLHLVLFGHITKSGSAVPGNNFLEKAYQATIHQSLGIFEAKLKESIEKGP